MGLIFISHASQDEEIAEFFVDSLKTLGVRDDNIFFSAKTHLGVGVGKRFTEVINQKLHESNLIVLLLTKNYYASYNCQQEEGVAWYEMGNKRIYPIRIGISLDDMKGFIDKTVIASEPQMINLRDIPYTLKDLGFIQEVPENKDQFNKFIERCSEYPVENVPVTMSQITPCNSEICYTEEDLILLNYFRENNLPLVIRERKTSNTKYTLEEYASDYPDFDSELRVKYFIEKNWLIQNNDGDYYLDSGIFDRIYSDSLFEYRIRDVSAKYKREKETLESLILSDDLSDILLMMLVYIWRNGVTELGDRWMSKSTIDDIIYWENANQLDHILSDNYNKALGYMRDNKWIYVKERTSYGNPRLYGINKDLMSQFKGMSDNCVNYLRTICSQHCLEKK